MRRQGKLTPIELAQERTWTPGKGWTTSRKWHGTHAAITGLAATIQAEQGRHVSMTVSPVDAGAATLTVSYDDLQDGDEPEAESNGEPEAEQDTWTLQGNDYEKDIWSHPSIKDLATTAKDDYDWLRKNLPPIQKNGTWQDVLDVWSGFNFDDPDTTEEIFKMFRDGVEAYSVSQFVLRRNRTFKSAALGTLLVDDVGKQFTLADLKTWEDVPDELDFALPADGAWVKRTPTVNYSGTKITADVEYWHADSWHEILYPTV